MKPIETTGIERAVSALLGKTTETLGSKLVIKILGRRSASTRRRRPAKPAGAESRRTALQKGGRRHG